MKRLFPLVIASLFVADAAFAEAKRSPSQDAGLGGGRYDGLWVFSATTTSGACPAVVPVDVTIESGRVVAANGGGAEPWGYVEGDGTFVARFTTAGHVSRANGSLRGEGGSGAWSSSTDLCGGSWRAQRSAKAGR